MSSTIGEYELSAAETNAFNQLKERISHLGYKEVEDAKIYRFLKAREFSVHQAESMLTKNLEWRKREKIDELLEEYKPNEILEKYFPFYILGNDLEGKLVMSFQIGNTDFKGLLKSVKKEDIVRHVVHALELGENRLKEQSQKFGKSVALWTAVVDFENCNISQITHKKCIELVVEIVSIYESNYPERLLAIYCINASIYFTIIFNIIKSLISANTIKKICEFGKEGWKEKLQDLIGFDELPAYLGGNKTDPDGNPRCVTMLSHGGTVPKSYYFKSAERRLKNKPGVMKHILKRSEKLDIPVNVKIVGSFLEWHFETENYTIGFGLSYKQKDDSNEKVLIPVKRSEIEEEYETGSYLCQQIGTYILKFDNSFSWFRQKELFCRIFVTTPDGKKSLARE